MKTFSRPVNILFFSSFGDVWGGGQISLFHLVKNIDASRFRCHVVVPSEGALAGWLKAEGIAVSILDLPKVAIGNISGCLTALFSLFGMIGEHRIDIIHTDGPRNTFYAGLIAKIRRLPLVWHIRASSRDKFDWLLVKFCSRLILVANSLRSRFDWLESSEQMVTIHNGANFSGYNTSRKSLILKKKYGLDDGCIVVAAVGRIERGKGQNHLVEACGMLKDRLPNFRLLLIGETAEPEYRALCVATARKYGIEDRLVFTGFIDPLSSILNEIQIVAFPSTLIEAFPRSIIEAMGAAIPVVAFDSGGCREAVEDQVSGFIIPPKDTVGMAVRIEILGRDEGLRCKMGAAARKRVEKCFTIDQNVRKTEQVYREILGLP